MKADDIPNECIEDPRFVKVLAASLCSEIAESKIILTEINTEIEDLKKSVSKGWEKRKILKQTIYELSKKKEVLTGAFESLTRDKKYRSIEIETIKNRLDDGTLREIEERAKFERILENYRDTWQKYKVEYEKRPLAIERQKCCINLKQLGVQFMIAEYKKEQFMKMMRQRWEINAMRIKRSLIDVSEMILNRWRDEKYREHLKMIKNNIRDELTAYTQQLSEMQQQELERKRRAESDETAKMPPPRLNFPFMRSINYTGEQRIHRRTRLESRSINNRERHNLMEHWRVTNKRENYSPPNDESDTASINTVMFEEIFHQDPNESSSPMLEDRSEKLDNVANFDNEGIQEVSHDIGLPSSIMTIHHSAESTNPIKNLQSNIINESSIHHALQKLDIEKKNDSLPRHHRKEQKQRSPMNNDESKKTLNADNDENNDENGNKNETNEYKKDTNNVELDSRSQRTRRWCQELICENLPNDQKSRSIREVSNNEAKLASIVREIPFKLVESHSIQRENGEREQKNSSRETNEQKIRKMDGNKGDTRSGTVNDQQRDSMPVSRLAESKGNAIIQKSKSRNDTLQADEGCRPKIRKIASNYDEATIMEVKQPQQQRTKYNITIEPDQPPNLSSPPRHYVSSCVSSDNLSHIVDGASWQEILQDTSVDELKTNVDFPSLSNWDNWSPPGLHSEKSFVSSSMTEHQNDKKDYSSIDQRQIQQDQSLMELEFAVKINKNPQKMF